MNRINRKDDGVEKKDGMDARGTVDREIVSRTVHPVSKPEYRCNDCGVLEGEKHHVGCQREICPICGGRVATCICYYHWKTGSEVCPFCGDGVRSCKCSIDVIFDAEIVHEPGTRHLKNVKEYISLLGTARYHDEGWIASLELEGRVPHVCTPNLCVRCGAVDPPFFMVPDDEWNAVIPINLRKKIFCKECYVHVRNVTGYNKGVDVEDYMLNARWYQIQSTGGGKLQQRSKSLPGGSVEPLLLFTDGGSRGNPGHAGIGFVVISGDIVITKNGRYIGKTTNNVAEYLALIYGLNHVVGMDRPVDCYSDSDGEATKRRVQDTERAIETIAFKREEADLWREISFHPRAEKSRADRGSGSHGKSCNRSTLVGARFMKKHLIATI